MLRSVIPKKAARSRKLACVRAATFAAALVTAICVISPAARADYAVLNTGVRLHISGYEQAGLNVRLHVDGGTVDVPADTIVRYEPEEIFARAIVPVAERGAYRSLRRTHQGRGEKIRSRPAIACARRASRIQFQSARDLHEKRAGADADHSVYGVAHVAAKSIRPRAKH